MDNEYRYHALPHSGLINDWFLSYVELARAVVDYLESDYKDSYEVPYNWDIAIKDLMAKDYEFKRTRIGKEDDWDKPDPADYRQKVGRPGWAGTGDYENYDYNKSHIKYRQDLRDYKEKKKALKEGTYKYKDNTEGAIEKLRDSGIEPDIARAYASAAGIKVINSQEDARGILNQFGRAQGDYVDDQLKKQAKINTQEDSVGDTTKPYVKSEALARAQANVERHQSPQAEESSAESQNRDKAQSFLDLYRTDFINGNQ